QPPPSLPRWGRRSAVAAVWHRGYYKLTSSLIAMQRSSDPNPSDSTRGILAQFLLFIGPIIAAGGILATIRPRELLAFYALLAPIGAAIWLAGVWLRFFKR